MELKINVEDLNTEGLGPDEVEETPFSRHEPDLDEIEERMEQHSYEDLVVIGNGGSITSFRAYLYAFIDQTDVEVHLVNTQDPDYLHRVERETDPEDTLVMPVSKSGETSSVIDAVLYFIERDYPMMAVTSDNDGALNQILEKRGHGFIEHPDVGGRFSGATETALVPAAFAGLDHREIRRGAENAYREYSEGGNPALEVANALKDAEEKGYREVLAPFYSTRMFGYYPLLVQLMHETVCKQGEGQTVYGDLGPEYQHHTNQRLFGGRQDVVPLFFRTRSHEHEEIQVPEDLSDVSLRDRALGEMDGMSMEHALDSEYRGVKSALDEEAVPNVTVTLESLDYASAGELLVFLQHLAVYSARLRDVDPYTQPDVEKSKAKGFSQRFDR
ncbi:MAG: hypothetical protein ABEK01_04585 [Candidatus Nanohaloarchaea archaeon]